MQLTYVFLGFKTFNALNNDFFAIEAELFFGCKTHFNCGFSIVFLVKYFYFLFYMWNLNHI